MVAAFTTRTTNEAEAKPELAKIPHLWQRFMQAFPEHSGETYSVYTNYQSDHHAEYTCGVGMKIDRHDECPPDMEVFEVPAADYLLYAANGRQPQAVVTAWQKVWTDFGPEQRGWQRTFTTDYERHSGPEEASLYIAVRKAA